MKIIDGMLGCPLCGDTNGLHHATVEIWDQNEDADTGLHVMVDRADPWKAGILTADTSMAGNPSSRRHGMKIKFFCELCGSWSFVSLAQHKGATEVTTGAAAGPELA